MSSTKRLLINNLMEEIRRMAGEQNTDGNISDDLLLDALNRATEESAMLLAEFDPEPLLMYYDFTTTSSVSEYPIPEDCLEDRIQLVELRQTGTAPEELLRVDLSESSSFEGATGTAELPKVWHPVGFERKIRLLPQPQSGLPIRFWYVRELPTNTRSQGRITTLNVASRYVTLDEVGDDLTASLDEDGSHVSIVDGQSGLIKATWEISSINTTTKRITFSASPTVLLVDNTTVTAPATADGVAVGDYLCIAPGSCICQLRHPFTNYMVQYAFALIQQVNGADAQIAYAALNRLEKFVKNRSKGTPSALRVKSRSHAFGRVARVNYPVTTK